MKALRPIVIALLLGLLLCADGIVLAEHVFLKDGTILDGTIIKDSPEGITLRRKNGAVADILRVSVLRILYTELSLAKVHIQKRDGQGMEVYIVDEDQKSFYYRYELNSPKEFKLDRSDVLFVAQKNPSSLKGEASTDRVKLAWYAPYSSVSHYKVYMKKKKNEPYVLAATTGWQKYTIHDLASNSQYYFTVTAVYPDKYESIPSNELIVTTKNILPERPGDLAVVTNQAKGGKSKSLLAWSPAVDPDGSIKEYRVYKKTWDSADLIGSTKGTSFELNGVNPLSLAVRAVDDDGGESDDASLRKPRVYDFAVAMTTGVPADRMGDMFICPLGVTFGGFIENIFIDNLGIGVEIGYLYFFGRELPGAETDENRVYGMSMVPITARALYRFRPWARLSLAPRLGLGYAFLHVAYRSSWSDSVKDVADRERFAFEPIVAAGMEARWDLSRDYSLAVGADYVMIVERVPLHSVTFHAGMVMHFGETLE